MGQSVFLFCVSDTSLTQVLKCSLLHMLYPCCRENIDKKLFLSPLKSSRQGFCTIGIFLMFHLQTAYMHYITHFRSDPVITHWLLTGKANRDCQSKSSILLGEQEMHDSLAEHPLKVGMGLLSYSMYAYNTYIHI